MIKKLFVTLILFPFILSAQYGESIRTARPGKAIGAFALGKNVFQMQNGYNVAYHRGRIFTAGDVVDNSTSQNTVLRLGLTENLEISAVINWTSIETKIDSIWTSVGGVSGTQFGARYNFSTNKGLIPTMAIQYRAILGLRNEYFKSNRNNFILGSRIVFSTGNRISKNWALTTNWILDLDHFENNPIMGYAIKTSYSISEKWSTYLELFGSLNPTLLVNFDTGLAYLVNKDFQLDISAGYYDDFSSLEYFYDFGLSWRFDWRE